MKKILAIFFILLLSILLISGCTSTPPENIAINNTQEAQTATNNIEEDITDATSLFNETVEET